MHVILLRQFSQRLLALDGGQRHLGLESRVHASGVCVSSSSAPDPRHSRRFQAEFPLIDLSEFGRPPRHRAGVVPIRLDGNPVELRRPPQLQFPRTVRGGNEFIAPFPIRLDRFLAVDDGPWGCGQRAGVVHISTGYPRLENRKPTPSAAVKCDRESSRERIAGAAQFLRSARSSLRFSTPCGVKATVDTSPRPRTERQPSSGSMSMAMSWSSSSGSPSSLATRAMVKT